MVKEDIIKKIETAGLVGRGGASYPVAQKWQAVKNALKTKKRAYIVINGAEGEPGVKKDAYILKNFSAEVINGLYLADRFLGSNKVSKIYFYLNAGYYRDYSPQIKKILATKKFLALNKKIEFFIKPEKLHYISGEETAILNLLEGKKAMPRLKPPYPFENGLNGSPTLINNVETFYDVSLVAAGKHEEKRFYTISGAVKQRGVFCLPAHLSINEVLRSTDNYPSQPFFVQIGGEASGEVLNSSQLDLPLGGTAALMVYDLKNTDKSKLLEYWLKFFRQQSCGQCTICREGTYRLLELINQKNYDKSLFNDLLDALEDSSFCALGSSLPIPVKSYLENILKIN
ncbi:MAG: NADH-ubiquinone oxidoreductase-F iron-sulfur binding region domain-containing protein [Patescibacteria group bacterium]